MLVNLIHVSKRQSNKSGNVLAASGSGYMQMQFHNASKPRLKSTVQRMIINFQILDLRLEKCI